MAVAMNAAVYRALLREVRRYGVPATIVACVSDPADADVIRLLLERADVPAGTSVAVLAQAGKGKRHAMGAALRLIAARKPLPGSIVVLMDGDNLLGPEALRKACSVLLTQPRVGAVTTENIPVVMGGAITREWYRLRMAQRHLLMCSVALSRKVMVLTGRFSVFRAEIATDPDFILTLEEDVLRHPRLGRIRMLTGDDKSTWFWTLRRGWQMLYLPDVTVHPAEELPRPGFFDSTLALMTRWYGNMMRNSGRALALGPRRCGLFLWLCLLDQRVSIWTAMTAPVVFGLASVIRSPAYLAIYLFWVLATRMGQALVLAAATGRFHPLFPFLLYYNQLSGALVKIYMLFHVNKQKWTRQTIAAGGDGDQATQYFRNLSSDVLLLLASLAAVLAIVWMSGVLTPGNPAALGAPPPVPARIR